MINFKKNLFMMFSNIFLILPVIYAFLYKEYLYLFFATGLFIFSPLFHWYRIKYRNSFSFKLFKSLDWFFGISAFIYMYYFIYKNMTTEYQSIFYLALFLVILFFYFGWKKWDYEKFHPYFHIIAPIVSSLILIMSN